MSTKSPALLPNPYLLVDDDKLLVCIVTQLLLQLDDLSHALLDKLSFRSDQLLTLLSRLVEEARVHLTENRRTSIVTMRLPTCDAPTLGLQNTGLTQNTLLNTAIMHMQTASLIYLQSTKKKRKLKFDLAPRIMLMTRIQRVSRVSTPRLFCIGRKSI